MINILLSIQTIPHKHIIDSVTTYETKVVLDTLRLPSPSTLDLISKVDTFYNNAWTKLIGSFTLIGVIVPALITWYQKTESNKREQELLDKLTKSENEIKSLIENTRTELREEIEKEYQLSLDDLKRINEAKLLELKKEVQINIAKMKKASKNVNGAMSLAIQAQISELKGRHNEVTFYLVQSLYYFIQLNSPYNIGVAFSHIEDSFTQITKASFDSYLDYKQMSFDKLTERIRSVTTNEDYLKRLDKIDELYKNIE